MDDDIHSMTGMGGKKGSRTSLEDSPISCDHTVGRHARAVTLCLSPIVLAWLAALPELAAKRVSLTTAGWKGGSTFMPLSGPLGRSIARGEIGIQRQSPLCTICYRSSRLLVVPVSRLSACRVGESDKGNLTTWKDSRLA